VVYGRPVERCDRRRGENLISVGHMEEEMQGKIRDEERLTEDEIARRKLEPRGVPGDKDSAKITPQQEKNLPKEGEFDGHVA
jgi:hypothetical protein